MSLGALTTPEQIERVAELFPTLVEKARAQSASPAW
jgi:cysteine sulfinate desulfinase/cysteine desulfurase-like protein